MLFDRPTRDFILPGESKIVQIKMAKMNPLPDITNTKLLRDKFLVQSVVLLPEEKDTDLSLFVRSILGIASIMSSAYADVAVGFAVATKGGEA